MSDIEKYRGIISAPDNGSGDNGYKLTYYEKLEKSTFINDLKRGDFLRCFWSERDSNKSELIDRIC